MMGLEVVEDGNHKGKGICNTIQNPVEKMDFTFDRSTREIGICTGGAAVNIAAFKKTRDKVGGHYIRTLCRGH